MHRNLNLLVVDDDPSIVRIVQAHLEKELPADVHLYTATSPEEAQRWLDEHCCDILISDIEMPDISGLEMLAFARRRNAWTQVAFLTGHSTWDRIAEAIEKGASDYLLKPIDREELLQVVSQIRARMVRWQQALKGTFETTASS